MRPLRVLTTSEWVGARLGRNAYATVFEQIAHVLGRRDRRKHTDRLQDSHQERILESVLVPSGCRVPGRRADDLRTVGCPLSTLAGAGPCVGISRNREHPTRLGGSGRTRRHAEVPPHSPSPVSVPRLLLTGKPPLARYRAPRLHAVLTWCSTAPALPHLARSGYLRRHHAHLQH